MRTKAPGNGLLAALVAFAVAGATGCATIPPERCATMDWHQLGIEDGQAGFGSSRIVRHREACARVKVVPDTSAWEAGRAIGLRDYCQLPNALEQGLARHGYEDVCDDPDFERLYRAARRVGDARYQIEFTDGEIDWRERELLTDRKLSDKRRGELRAEIRSLERERDRARDDRWEAELALDRVRRDLGI